MRRRTRTRILLAALGSAALAAGVAYSRRVVRSAEERFPASGEFVELPDGGRLHVLRGGEAASGELPVVMIHGSDGVLQEFSATVFANVATRHAAIAVDRPGHGWSMLPHAARADVPTNAAMIRACLRELGITRVVLVGHSYGCAVSLRWAIDHPDEVAGLVLVSPAAYFAWTPLLPYVCALPGLPVVGAALAEALVVPFGPLVLKFFGGRAFRPRPVPDAYADFARALYLRPRQALALAEEYRFLSRDLPPMAPRYRDIAVPTRILVGAEDLVTVPEKQAVRLAAEIPDAELEVFPGLGHEMQWQAQDEIAAAIDDVAGRIASAEGRVHPLG